MKKIIEQQLKEKSKSLYHDFGHFAIEFEQMVLSVKICIFTIFKKQGLVELEYLRVLLHDQTAAPMVSKLQSLLAIYFKAEPEKSKSLDKLFTYTNKLIEKRNQLVHGSIFINSTFPEAELFKDKTGKVGVAAYEEKFDQTKFIDITTKVILTKNMFDLLSFQMFSPDDKFQKYFSSERIEELKMN